MVDFLGKVAVVSGGAQGLGRAFAEVLSSKGVNVLLFDVRLEVLDIASGLGSSVRGLVADVSKPSDVEQVISTACDQFGGVDILINNAAIWKRTPVSQKWEDAVVDFDTIMNTNLKGVLMLSRACVPSFKARGGGDIVNISSRDVLPARSFETNPIDQDLYLASKWALNGFTDAWAHQLQEHNIRVNGLCVGPMATPMRHAQLSSVEGGLRQEGSALAPDDVVRTAIELIDSGRTGENVGLWPGEPLKLGSPPARHLRVTNQ